ncbi:Hsp20/alpha crystallin family protein [Deinococcus deserti]|uniref:Putative heat shock protein Hsp20 n=1 Tax=Deinococcus deserti (strain DSM 17065 / CIP 109153 / LMG 22923 / VCD115) TaxID=546414 RepID=C1CV16_DEIDV|nr:Hsp20/alpha crystallin family protein [Deinococcus deserti]ACO46033.1 putative heat shock protein Hsp20 [Deinococcus deserti VCD115]
MNEPVLSRLQHLMTLREGVEALTSSGPWVPLADWTDSDSHITLHLDVPGVVPDSLALHETGESVTISGERPAPQGRLSAERPHGVFSRTLGLPVEIVPQSGQATLANGVLCVQFEKRHPTINVHADEYQDPDSNHP